MIALPVIVNEHCYDLFIVMQEDNVTRIKAYDPAEVVTANFAAEFMKHKVRNVIVMYGNEGDIALITMMCRAGDVRGALRHLSRGYRWRPGAADRDESGGYESALETPP
jgi:hypothetical protein